MAYPAYDTYNNGLGYSRPSMYPAYDTYGGYNDHINAGIHGENYPHPAYPVHPIQHTVGSVYHPAAYDDLDVRDYDHGYSTPYSGAMRRRHSSMHYRTRPPLDGYRRFSSTLLKFKRKGGTRTGITLGEAMASVRLSGSDSYSVHDLGADHRGRIILKIRWPGYTSMTYEIPVDGYDGRVELETLARRIARACTHYIQANMIPISWDRVILYHLEEISIGTWQPVLSTA